MLCVWQGAAADLAFTPVSLGGDETRRRRWGRKLQLLRPALRDAPPEWHVVLDFQLQRAGRSLDAVILTPGCILACTLREGRRHAGRDAAEDAALDLHDFHAGSRFHPVIPLVVTTAAGPGSPARPLLFPGVAPCMEANGASFGPLLHELASLAPAAPALAAADWLAAPYHPTPGLIEAARALYARHGVADITTAGADRAGLRATRAAIQAALATAAADRRPTIVFVTGVPGAGKTLCGLDTALGASAATFLTGNPALVHVLREALARDAAASRSALRATRQRMEGVIQALPFFRDAYAAGGTPPERVIVVDEAQRCWTAAHAIAKTAARRVRLTQSEPAHLLDAMGRRSDGPVIVCLVGGGQEIHDGEGGLAGWGEALRTRPEWRVHAPPGRGGEPRQRLAAPVAVTDPALHLATTVRALRCPNAPGWADAVLAGDAHAARAIGPVPFTVVRDLAALRTALRRTCRGTRRAGLVASSGARRLRAEGLGATLPHDDPAAVTRWYLDRFPDIRASDALEVAATEFFCQGLELDAVGLCWDGDLVREGGRWAARALRGTTWSRLGDGKAANRLNAYRVLLTRARRHTFIWVPRGDAADPTRDPSLLDAVADFLLQCGAGPALPPEPAAPTPKPHQDLFA